MFDTAQEPFVDKIIDNIKKVGGGGIHERATLLATRRPGDPHPFVDPVT